MTTKQAKNAVGLRFEVETGLAPLQETGLNPAGDTQLTPAPRTKRPYKKRARQCSCGCGETVTPSAQAPHKRFVDDTHRKRWHRKQEAKIRKDQPVAEPMLAMYTCLFCGATFLAEVGRGAKWCKPSHGVQAADHRRYAAGQVFIEAYNMTPDDAENMIENSGMKNVSVWLRQNGYSYDEIARRWAMALTAGDVFAERGIR